MQGFVKDPAAAIRRMRQEPRASFRSAENACIAREMTVITDTDTLSEYCRNAADQDFITVDTEFIRDKTYWPQLCLVQIGVREDAVAIDTLAADIDLEPLYALMADKKTLKVFHAARQDIEIFFHQTGDVPGPLFDTQVAAMVCGYGDAVGYERLVTSLTKASIDKSMRFTDWSRRPLSSKQINYALGDVTHLQEIYRALSKRLDDSGRAEWVAEEMATLTDPGTYRLVPDEAWRRIKTRNRNRRFLAILRELASWRESEAQTRDVPRNRILRDDLMVEIAVHAPKSPEELSRLRGFARDKKSKDAMARILDVVARGVAIPEKDCPKPPDNGVRGGTIGASVDLLKVLLKQRCEQHEVAQKLVATTDDIEAIARSDKADVAALRGWRRQIFGADAIALKHGRLALTADGKNIKVLDIKD